MENHALSPGIWLRIYKKNSGVKSVTFDEIFDEGLFLVGVRVNGLKMMKYHICNDSPLGTQ